MSLYFRNLTPNPVFICIIGRDSACHFGLRKRGWYRVVPGETQRVWFGNARLVDSYYAEDDFGHVWSGDGIFTDIPNTSFNWCLTRKCSPCRRLGFRYLDVIEEDLIIELTLSSNQRTSRSGNIRKAFPTKRKLKSGINRLILKRRLEGKKE